MKKPGRNDPCPCGSGKKYKHCHLGKDAAEIASALQDAWRAFHRGDFEAAYDQGVALKAIGASVAIKAGGIHAAYLVDDDAAM